MFPRTLPQSPRRPRTLRHAPHILAGVPDFGPPPLGLLKPGAFPQATKRVELIQTHISYVFLTDEYVYKVKKAVDFGFLDYSTLGKRRYYCHREVRLNSLLCEHTYFGVVPIRRHRGAFVLGGREGTIVEYAVWMRRLPEDRMLNRLIERGGATMLMVERVAEKLVPFHQTTAETSPAIAPYGDWAIRYNHRENVEQWVPYVGHVRGAERSFKKAAGCAGPATARALLA